MNSIALVDFNSFFASVEQQDDPRLRGKPVGVLPVMAETTCCIAASYEAKAFGVKTGTGVREARKLCPGMVFIEARHARYVQVHKQSLQIVDRIAPVYEVLSIDEMSCELTGRWSAPEQATKIAQRIKAALRAELGDCMKVSIGIAPNTLLAKLASNMQKPDGLVLLGMQDIPLKFLHLAPSAINGIGPRMAKRLVCCGIHSMADLYAAPRDLLRTAWAGKAGDEMYDMLRGMPYAPRQTTARSLGHSHMLPPQMRNPTDALAVLNRLTQKAAMRLRKQGFYATAMGVHVRSEMLYHANAQDRRSGGRDTRFGETQDTAFFFASPAYPVAQRPAHHSAAQGGGHGAAWLGSGGAAHGRLVWHAGPGPQQHRHAPRRTTRPARQHCPRAKRPPHPRPQPPARRHGQHQQVPRQKRPVLCTRPRRARPRPYAHCVYPHTRYRNRDVSHRIMVLGQP